jgi:hypothetical protein
MLRITFPAREPHHLLVQPNARAGQGFVEVRAAQHEIVGYNPVERKRVHGAVKLCLHIIAVRATAVATWEDSLPLRTPHRHKYW